jgi:hypothetical protein
MCLWDAGTEPPSEDAMVHGRTTSHMGTCVPRSTGPGWSLDQGPSTGPRTGVVGGHSDHVTGPIHISQKPPLVIFTPRRSRCPILAYNSKPAKLAL